jgi:hypothetical protein
VAAGSEIELNFSFAESDLPKVKTLIQRMRTRKAIRIFTGSILIHQRTIYGTMASHSACAHPAIASSSHQKNTIL